MREHCIREDWGLRVIWVGIAILTVGVLWSAFKGWVVWNIAHDLFNSGGAPTLDFPLFCPIPLAVGASLVLTAVDLYPFPWFGLVAYIGLAVGFGLLLWLFDRIGHPERQRQLDAVKHRSSSADTATPAATPEREKR